MLELKHIRKKYPTKLALQDVDLEIGPGEIVGLFGENGAGKTTLLKSVLGLLNHDGEVLLDGQLVTRKNTARLSFATCEHSFFPDLNARDHQIFYEGQFPTFRAKRFWTLMDFFELPKSRAIRSFSTGQKNQFEVILALCQGADYILMDEPFAGNDIFNREDFYKVLLGILEPNETVILSTHLLEEVEQFISRAVLLKKGKIVGDVSLLSLQEQGKDLISYVKEVYSYQADRVLKALTDLNEEP